MYDYLVFLTLICIWYYLYDFSKEFIEISEKIEKLEAALSKQKEFNDYVIGYIHRQNEKEEQMKIAKAIMEKRKEVFRGLDD